MRVAVVHDWLSTYTGAERVLEQILRVFPDADLFAVFDVMPASERGFLAGRAVRTSPLQRAPLLHRWYRHYLPLMPLAVEQLDVSGYDLVLSSSWAVAKGVLTGPDQLHVCYCHTPVRYAWELQHEYLRAAGLTRGLRGAAVRYLLHRLRIWDVRTHPGVDSFVANSGYVARRIRKTYRRDAVVIHPPVDVAGFTPGGERDDYYLTMSRLVPYKRIDLIVEAFAAMPARRLVVIGDGPDRRKLERLAPANVTLLGHVPEEALRERLRRARAFVFAADEDFGIAPVEAQACGTPVIALGRGGALETVRGLDDPAPTGVLYAEQSADGVRGAVELFERSEGAITAAACRENALRFGPERFRRELTEHVAALLAGTAAGAALGADGGRSG